MEAYLDNSATTRVDAQVQELMKKLMDVDFGNPSSRHQKGVVAEGYIKEARQKIAACAGELCICKSFSGNRGTGRRKAS